MKKVEIYPEPQENGQLLKSIQFRFPVFFQGNEADTFFPNSETTAETVCLLLNQNAKSQHYVNIGIDTEDYYRMKENNEYQER